MHNSFHFSFGACRLQAIDSLSFLHLENSLYRTKFNLCYLFLYFSDLLSFLYLDRTVSLYLLENPAEIGLILETSLIGDFVD